METNQNNAINNIRIAVESINSVIAELNNFKGDFLNVAYENPENFEKTVKILIVKLNDSIKHLSEE